jgi:serine/threonine protein kinase
MADLTLERYEILREIGRGGMATVYLARQIDLDRLVALKELGSLRDTDPSFTQRFLREARLAGSMSHPNIVTVHDFFERRGVPVIAMEYVRRGSLRPYVGALSLAQIGGILEGLLDGLAHAETHGVVHRDLKPENLLVSDEGRVKIVDFGIAKATSDLRVGSFVTSTGIAVGTPNYVAPEQAMAHEIGPWTDLYSVGIVTFELFVGRAPFADTPEPMAVLLRQVNEPVPPLSEIRRDVHPLISDWIEWLLAKEPSERPQSARQAWLDLEERLVAILGPRWQRDAPLPELEPPVLPVAGPATPPPFDLPTGALTEADIAAFTNRLPTVAASGAADPRTQARTVVPGDQFRQGSTAPAPAAPPRRRKRSWRSARLLALLALPLVAWVATHQLRASSPPAANTASTVSSSADAGVRPPNGSPGASNETNGEKPASSDLTEQASALQSVAAQYENAATNIAAVDAGSPTPARTALGDALRGAAAAYRRAAEAAARNDSAAYAPALEEARTWKASVEDATNRLRTEGQPAPTQQTTPAPSTDDDSGTSPPPGSEACSGDSSSDDPSDDECEP